MKQFSRVIFMLLVICILMGAVVVPANSSEVQATEQNMDDSEILELIQRLREYSSEIHAEEDGKNLFGIKIAEDMEMAANELERLLGQQGNPFTGSRYSDIELTQDEKDLLASIVWLEARGESFEGQQAVAEVVFNRMVADNFPDTLRGVIYAEGQFPTAKMVGRAEPDETQYEAIERALSGPYVLPLDVVFFAQFAVNDNVWGQIGGHTFCYQWWVKNMK